MHATVRLSSTNDMDRERNVVGCRPPTHLSVKLLVSVNCRAALALAASWRAPCRRGWAKHGIEASVVQTRLPLAGPSSIPGWQWRPVRAQQNRSLTTTLQARPNAFQTSSSFARPSSLAPTSITMSVRGPLLGITVVSRLSGAPSNAATASAS